MIHAQYYLARHSRQATRYFAILNYYEYLAVCMYDTRGRTTYRFDFVNDPLSVGLMLASDAYVPCTAAAFGRMLQEVQKHMPSHYTPAV